MIMWVRWLLFAGLTVTLSLASTELKVGFLSTMSPESWLQETWSQFKLAIMDVNADPAILPGYRLTYVAEDAEAKPTPALQGTDRLLAAGVVAIVGAPENEVLEAAATQATLARTPLLSSGSTAFEFVDKRNYPFLFRTMQGDLDIFKAMAVLCKEMSWLRVVTLTNNDLRVGERMVLAPTLQVMNIVPLSFRYMSPVDALTRNLTLKTLFTVNVSGFMRVILWFPKRVDLPFIYGVTKQGGMIGPRFTWMTTQEAYTGPYMMESDMVVAMRTDGGPNPARDYYMARWAMSSTRYNVMTHGPFDPATKLPFYNVSDSTLWDTGDFAPPPGMVPPGDQQADIYGMSTYDSVFVLAKALQAVIGMGASPNNGTALWGALRATTHQGVTGAFAFNPLLNDRMAPVQLILTQGLSTTPPNLPRAHPIGQTTASLNDLPGPTWCSNGTCLTATPQQLMALPWSTGMRPGDGRGVYHGATTPRVLLFNAEELQDLSAGISTRDMFGQVVCRDTCSQGAQLCQQCHDEILRPAWNLYDMRVLDQAGNVLQPVNPIVRGEYTDAGSLLFTFRGGIQGMSYENRVVNLTFTFMGQPWNHPDANVQVNLRSLACAAGQAGVGGYRPCSSCLPGSISPRRGSSNCTLCPAGTSQPSAGEGSCSNCAPGSYSATVGAAECSPCGLGFFQPQSGSLQCQECPSSMTTFRPGNTDISACVCKEGTYLPQGTVLRPGMPGPCQVCKKGMECPVGSDAANFPSATAVVTQQSMREFPFPQLKPSYWAATDNPLSIFLCYQGESQCPGGKPESCGPHMEDQACAMCQEGYYARDGLCHSCPSTAVSKMLFPSVPIIASILVVGPLYIANKDNGIISWNKSKTLLGQLAALLIVYVQTAGLLLTSNLVGLTKDAENTGAVMNIINVPLGLLQIDCVGIRSFALKLSMNLGLPAYFLLIVLFLTCLNLAIGRWQPKLLMDTNVLCSCVGTAFTIFYITICAISFDLFKCYEHPNTEQSVVSAPQVLCYHGQWTTMMGVAMAAVAVYCLGSMVIFIWALRQSPRRVADKGFNKRWKFMLVKYRPSANWWFIVVLVKGIAMNLTQVIFVLGQDQLFFLQAILVLYSLGVIFKNPWRHTECNWADAFSHIILSIGTGLLFWYSEAETESPLRAFIVRHALWLPVILLGLFVIFHGMKESPHLKRLTRRRATVTGINLQEWIEDYYAFGELEKEDFYDFLEGMSPEDRKTVEETAKDIDVMLLRWTQESSMAMVDKITSTPSGMQKHLSNKQGRLGRMSKQLSGGAIVPTRTENAFAPAADKSEEEEEERPQEMAL